MLHATFRYIPFLALTLLFANCSSDDDKESPANSPQLLFSDSPTSKTITAAIKEASGIADSKTAPGNLWVVEDSGNPPQLHLLNYNGEATGKVYLKGATNRDWEDLVLFENQLFIADIGDNKNSKSNYTIYQFPEPGAGTDTVKTFNRIRFRYADGPRDAEALLLDPQTKDILLITKQDNPSRIYKLTYPYNYTTIDTARFVGNLTFTGVVGAALSPDGSEALLKTYLGLYYYKLQAGQTLQTILQQTPGDLAYTVEPQGEAVTFARDNSGFYTLSEKALSDFVNLYFYKRK